MKTSSLVVKTSRSTIKSLTLYRERSDQTFIYPGWKVTTSSVTVINSSFSYILKLFTASKLIAKKVDYLIKIKRPQTCHTFCILSLYQRFISFSFSQPFITIRNFGATRSTSIFQEERLGLTITRLSYRPTGTHAFLKSASAWGSANRPSSLSSTSTPTLCTHWLLTGNTAPPHWVVTRGRRWLVHRPLCKTTVTEKGSMLCASKARIFITSNNENKCTSRDSRIGFGTGGSPDHSNTCGNEATSSPDNGDKHIKAMGYILVQW